MRSYPIPSLSAPVRQWPDRGRGTGKGRGAVREGEAGGSGRRAARRAVIGAIHSLGMVVSSAILGNS